MNHSVVGSIATVLPIDAYKRDGTWDDDATLKAALIPDTMCTLPTVFETRDKTLKGRGLLDEAQHDLARKALARDYHPYFEYHLKCAEGHYVTFYGGQAYQSIIREGSQILNFNVTIEGAVYKSLELYYQLRKHKSIGMLVTREKSGAFS